MILITGTSGQLGSLIANKAKHTGLNIITASRAIGSDRQLDFDDIKTLNFMGVDTLLLISAGYAEDDVVINRHNNVLIAAKEQGVQHVIYTSLSKASDHLAFALAHRWTERQLKQSGMKWTILRNGLYAELIGGLAQPTDNRITAPFGYDDISAVAREDLADAAVTVLKDTSKHRNKIYELSGIKPFSLADIAKHLSLDYEPTTLEKERARLSHLELLPFQPAMLMSIYNSAMAGFLQTSASDLTMLVSQPKDPLAIACSAAIQTT